MTRKSMSPTNHELQLVNDFVQYTGCNIFLTGKAGTGKTTFLHNMQKNTTKRMIIIAPTGVAAINVGAVLFARNLNDFDRLARKALRVIIYRGDNRVKPLESRWAARGMPSVSKAPFHI